MITAAALKCMGGEMLSRLWPRDDGERQAALDAGYDLDRVLTTDDLVAGDNCFFAATGITDGELLKGVHYDRNGATTQSLVMRSKSGTVRMINARHNLTKLGGFSAIELSLASGRQPPTAPPVGKPPRRAPSASGRGIGPAAPSTGGLRHPSRRQANASCAPPRGPNARPRTR